MQRSLFPDIFDDENEPVPQRSAGTFSPDSLNAPQHAAVTHDGGPVLVIAGAGSGKTRTLVYRVAWLISRGVSPDGILLLTFTRRSAQEMLHRAADLLDESCRQVWGGTFHAVGNILLRQYGSLLGYDRNFTIIDRSDAEGIVNLLKNSLGVAGAGKRFPNKRVIIDTISRAANRSLPMEHVFTEQHPHLENYLDDVLLIADHYRTFKRDHGLMDYDDLLLNWRQLMTDHPDVRQQIADRFSHLLVDEYQDTNLIQADIVKLVGGGHGNVMAVGDDAQSIYSFRGADFKNIMEFPNHFPGTRIIRLEENYRSTTAILDVANAVMRHAVEKYDKNLFSSIVDTTKPVLYTARDEAAQARFVVEKISALLADGMPMSEIAVLFRSGYHSYKLELELANHRIGFEKRGGMKLTESAHIKDVISFLRLLSNPDDSLSWNRVLLQLEKIGPRTAQNIILWLREVAQPLTDIAGFPGNGKWKSGLVEMAKMFSEAREMALPVAMFDRIMQYYQGVFERIYHDDYPRRSRDLEHLRTIVAGYENLQGFIDDVALDPPEGMFQELAHPTVGEKLVLSTIHSAKGLEWDAVFIIHLADGKFPSAQAADSAQLEEERRLFYVALTRARRHLFLSWPQITTGFDRQASYGMVSAFVEQIPRDLLALGRNTAGYRAPERFQTFGRDDIATARQPPAAFEKKVSESTAVIAAFGPGARVRHPFFGEGRVEKMVGERTVNVHFDRHGAKTLHLDYAKLEPVSP